MRKLVIFGLLVLALAACTSGHGGSQSEPPPTPEAVAQNPVNLLQQAGATVPPEVQEGQHGFLAPGEKFATGKLKMKGVSELECRTYPSSALRDEAFQSAPQPFASDDTHTVIVGEAFVCTISFELAYDDARQDFFPPDAKLRKQTAATVAKRIGGKII